MLAVAWKCLCRRVELHTRTRVVMRDVAVAEDLDHDTSVEVRQRPLLRHGDQVASDEAGEHRLVPQDVLRPEQDSE